MSEQNRATTNTVFMFSLWLFLPLAALIAACIWNLSNVMDQTPEPSLQAVLTAALLILLTGVTIAFLSVVYAAIAHTTKQAEHSQPIRFPIVTTTCIATLAALTCLATYVTPSRWEPLDSGVEMNAFLHVEHLPSDVQIDTTSDEFWRRLASHTELNTHIRGPLARISPIEYLRERVQITRENSGGYQVTFRFERAKDERKLLAILAQKLQSDFESQIMKGRAEMLRVALESLKTQRSYVQSLTEGLIDTEYALASYTSRASNVSLTAYNGRLSQKHLELAVRARLLRLEVDNAADLYSQLSAEVVRLERLPQSVVQTTDFGEVVPTPPTSRPAPLPQAAATFAAPFLLFAAAFLLVFCFWCMARHSQRHYIAHRTMISAVDAPHS